MALEAIAASTIGVIVFGSLLFVALLLTFAQSKFGIDDKYLTLVWDLVKISMGALLTFIFGGAA